MTVSAPTAGAFAYSSSGGLSVSPAYPASIGVNNALIMTVHQKPATANGGGVATPADWTLIGSAIGQGGYGATLGADTGNTNLYVFRKNKVDGTETGSVAVALTDNNIARAEIIKVSNDTGRWDIAVATGSDINGGNLSAAMSSDPGVNNGDLVIVDFGIATDVTTPSQFSAEAITQTGVTFGARTELGEPDSAVGNQLGGVLFYAAATAGPSSGVPTVTATAGGTTTNVRGPVVFIRLRELPAVVAGSVIEGVLGAIAAIQSALHIIEAGIAAIVDTPAGTWWNPSDKNADIVLTNSNKTAENVNVSVARSVRSVTHHAAGKWYVEFEFLGADPGKSIGLARADFGLGDEVGNSGSLGFQLYSVGVVGNDGNFDVNGIAPDNTHIVGLAWDRDNNTAYLSVDGTFVVGDPVAGTGGVVALASQLNYVCGSANVSSANKITIRTDVSEMDFTPPTGYSAWG